MTESTSQKSPVEVFDCSSCGAPVTIRAIGQTISVVCGSCESIIDAVDPRHQIVSRFHSKLKIVPKIKIGDRGILRGKLWECIGFMQREDGAGEYNWREYLLFNPKYGFRWLTEFNGHWNFVRSVKVLPKKDPYSLSVLLGASTDRSLKKYRLFYRGVGRVNYVIGEFYWRVKVGETVDIEDYIAPPEILSSEANEEEIVWSVGEYIEKKEIENAFKLEEPLPLPIGISPNQPSKVSETFNSIRKYWIFFIVVLAVVQFFYLSSAQNKEVYKETFVFDPTHLEDFYTTGSFLLEGKKKNVEVILESSVENSWFEIEADLISETDGKTYEFEEGTEYYYGYDSDGFWQEGSKTAKTILSSIPDGKYHLKFKAVSEASEAARKTTTRTWSYFNQRFTVSVKRDVPIFSNVFLAMLFISIFGGILWWKKFSFEKRRWSESDF